MLQKDRGKEHFVNILGGSQSGGLSQSTQPARCQVTVLRCLLPMHMQDAYIASRRLGALLKILSTLQRVNTAQATARRITHRRIISAASDALITTWRLSLYDSVTPSSRMDATCPKSMSRPESDLPS